MRRTVSLRRRAQTTSEAPAITRQMPENALYYGDNLDVLRLYVKDETVDLVYLDPPFNSHATYSVLFGHADGTKSAAQIKAFEDTWHWDQTAATAFHETVVAGGAVASALTAFQTLLGPSTMLAYLSMMAPRLVELRRVLKPTGSIYLHCDTTASHYLKLLMDSTFGPENFRNDVTWKRTSGHSDARRFGRVHDVILYYVKTDHAKWNQLFQAYDEEYVRQYYRFEDQDGRRFMSGDLSAAGLQGGGYDYEWKGVQRVWRVPLTTMKRLDTENRIYYTKNGMPRLKRYLDESKGLPAQDVWGDIEALRSWHAERLGYPTQKPEGILERIITASSDPGDVVLDPFCGCGTTIAAAEKLKRKWIGIDLTALAISLIKSRLTAAGASDYKVFGEPTTADDAEELARTDPYGFQWWSLGLIGARPAEGKKGADHGIDGRLFFFDDDTAAKQVIVSVKAGKVQVPHVRDLVGVLDREKAQIGVLISLNEPTQPMRSEGASAGFYTSKLYGDFPRVQLLTVAELLEGKTIQMPNSGGPQGMTVALPPTPEEVHPDQMTLG
jgi:DNA modification methylase